MLDDKNFLKEKIELPDVVLSKANYALDLIQREESKHMSRRKSLFKMQAAAVAGVCVLAVASVGVVAAIHHNWGRGMNGNIQASDSEQQQLTDEGIAEVYTEKEDYESLKVTQNGVTIAPNTVIVDNRFAYISFTIEGFDFEDGKEPGFENVNVSSKDTDFNICACMYDGIISSEEGLPVYEDGSQVKDDENGDIICQYLDENGNLEYFIQAHVSEEKDSALGKTINVEFKNIGTLNKADFTNSIDGVWNFDIKLPNVSSEKHFDINAKLDGSGVTVVDAEISPVSMKVNYLVSDKAEIVEDNLDIPVVMGVVLKDGTRIPYLTDGGRMGYTDDTHAFHMAGYDRVIEVEDVQALLIQLEPGQDFVEVNIQ